MGDFKKLKVWRKAHAFVLAVRRATVKMRGREHATLRNQLMRAAMSIATNIVEARGQKSDRQFIRFLEYALNSTAESEYHLSLARDTCEGVRSDVLALLSQVIEIRKMLHGLIASVSAGKRPHATPRSEDDGSRSSEAPS